MSLYTSKIQSLSIDPIFNKSKMRTEHKFTTDGLYYPNLRLLNIGVVSSAANSTIRYNFLTGNGSSIKNIYLMDGSVVLDQVLNFQIIEALKRYNQTNEVNCDFKILHQNGLGFVLDSLNSGVTANDLPKSRSFSQILPVSLNLTRLSHPKAILIYVKFFPSSRFFHLSVLKCSLHLKLLSNMM